ncbi:MAG: hypothetical protein AAF639_25080 [Chloroflexota bacterium]
MTQTLLLFCIIANFAYLVYLSGDPAELLEDWAWTLVVFACVPYFLLWLYNRYQRRHLAKNLITLLTAVLIAAAGTYVYYDIFVLHPTPNYIQLLLLLPVVQIAAVFVCIIISFLVARIFRRWWR